VAGQSNIPPVVIRQILQSNNESETQRILNTYSKNKGLTLFQKNTIKMKYLYNQIIYRSAISTATYV
jgi:hypothetical protein